MAEDVIKLHRRAVRLDGRDFTTLSLRPGDPTRLATNRFHETWHVLGDAESCHRLGRMMWGLAHQLRAGTFVVVDQRHLVPNPFDADPSSPLVIVNSDLGTPSRRGFDRLRALLPWRTASEGTVRLRTPGLELAQADEDEFLAAERRSGAAYDRQRQRSRIDEVNGLLVLAAPASKLRHWALDLGVLGDHSHLGSDSTYLDRPTVNGEVQALDDFDGMLTRAVAARRRAFPGRDHERLLPEERRLIWYDPERVAAADG